MNEVSNSLRADTRAKVRHPARQYCSELPGSLRDVRRDARELLRSVRLLWPFVWRVTADREREAAETDMFWLGREWDRQDQEASA